MPLAFSVCLSCPQNCCLVCLSEWSGWTTGRSSLAHSSERMQPQFYPAMHLTYTCARCLHWIIYSLNPGIQGLQSSLFPPPLPLSFPYSHHARASWNAGQLTLQPCSKIANPTYWSSSCFSRSRLCMMRSGTYRALSMLCFPQDTASSLTPGFHRMLLECDSFTLLSDMVNQVETPSYFSYLTRGESKNSEQFYALLQTCSSLLTFLKLELTS